jgi:hypothetical protein
MKPVCPKIHPKTKQNDQEEFAFEVGDFKAYQHVLLAEETKRKKKKK